MFKRILAFAFVAILLTGSVAADWIPTDGHKMHFPQTPDSVGWNVEASLGGTLADDWQCSETGPVSQIHFWGSWEGGLQGTIRGFYVSIYSDVPDPDPGNPLTFSQPGTLLWGQYVAFEDVVSYQIEPVPQMWEGWYDPVTGVFVHPDHDNFFAYNITDIAEPFIQIAETIYWLSIQADIVEMQDPQPTWGWKSSTLHWNDRAVYLQPDVEPGSCNVPDDGTGTATYPPMGCDFTSPDEVMMIIDGLPPGTTIEMDPIIMDFLCSGPPGCGLGLLPGVCEGAGGSLGGTGSCFEATLDLTVTGTGDLAGFSRHLAVPIWMEVHMTARTPGDPVQSMVAVIQVMQGELFGDPDFCTFRISGGTGMGLPSPGQVTMTKVNDGTFNVDSFFDITYQIEFEGCPGSVLEDLAGTTTATLRMVQGDPIIRSVALDFPTKEFRAGICEAPDNGTGTITYPPMGCDFTSPEEVMMIIDGLPPGTTIEMEDFITDFLCTGGGTCSLPIPPSECEMGGGSLGGTGSCFEATLDLTVSGAGELEGFNRHLAVPIFMEVHLGQRNPGDPVQTIVGVVFRLQGELFGDPDFCTFRIVGGSNFGLPSPGQVELTRLPSGDFNVDSFFDITYQIEFEGCPGSQLADYAGTTTATIRIEQGGPVDLTENWQPMDEPSFSAPTTNNWWVAVDPGGAVVWGDGVDAYGDGWYFYPLEDWWNIWFYDHPLAYDRYKVVHIEFDAFPMEPGPTMLELAVNWSTPLWSEIGNPPGPRRPPLPDDGNEEGFIGRQILFVNNNPAGHYIVDYIIEDYNPEWVSIDIRGFNYVIETAWITHECVSQGDEPMDLAFVINDDPSASCCRLRGDVDHDGSFTPNIADLVYLVSYMFQGGPVPPCDEPYLPDCPVQYYPEADVDGDGSCTPNIADLVYLVAYMFQGGPIPPAC